jgi:transcriptional regulator with XRE-family HTH domain
MNQYAFDVLPIHPPPHPLESFTSYLTRLAQENGIQHFSDIAYRLFPGLDPLSVRGLTDYPPSSWGNLAREAACTENTLLATTFYHLARKFGRTPSSRPLAPFFSGAIAPSLRYCPQCLVEQPYYRLCWRLSLLTGCPDHGCSLLDRCGGCGRPLGLLNSNLQIGICPHCSTDLRTCVAPALDSPTWLQMKDIRLDLKYLLLPQAWETGTSGAAIAAGHEFARLRRHLAQSTAEVSRQAGITQAGVRSVERGCALSPGAILLRYFRYAHYLGIPLRHIFENGLEHFASVEQEEHLTYEQQLEARLQRAVRRLQSSAHPINDQTLREWTGLSLQTLHKHPTTRAILERLETEAYHQRETLLLQQVETAIQSLLSAGQPAMRQDIYRLVGKGKFALKAYPCIRERLAQLNISPRTHKPVRPRRNEHILLEQVNQAIRDLRVDRQPITQTAIGERVGLCLMQLRRYPQVKTLLEQTRQLCAAQREADLLERAKQAVHAVQETGRPFTLKALANHMSISVTSLARYPAIHAFLKSFPKQQTWKERTEHLSRVTAAITLLKQQQQLLTKTAICQLARINENVARHRPELDAALEAALTEQKQAHAQQLLERVTQAIETLQATNQRISTPAVCALVGMSVPGLRNYPQAVELIRAAHRENRTLYKARLLRQVEEAARQLQSRGLPLTQRAICAYIGISYLSLPNYPAVRAAVSRIAKDYHATHATGWGTRYGNHD